MRTWAKAGGGRDCGGLTVDSLRRGREAAGCPLGRLREGDVIMSEDNDCSSVITTDSGKNRAFC